LTPAKDFPKHFRLSSDFAEQKGLGEDDAPGPDGKNQKNRQDESRDRGCLAENVEQIQLIQMCLLKVKNLTVRH